jgi:hypothetical protein
MVRQKIRDAYKIPGSWMVDLGLVLCCTCCTVAQQSIELRKKGVKPGIIDAMVNMREGEHKGEDENDK